MSKKVNVKNTEKFKVDLIPVAGRESLIRNTSFEMIQSFMRKLNVPIFNSIK